MTAERDAARQTGGAAQQAAGLPFQVQAVADFESPWAMTFLPDGRMLITEKSGILYVVSADGQQRRRVDGIPAVSSEGQGGLMDVVLHPDGKPIPDHGAAARATPEADAGRDGSARLQAGCGARRLRGVALAMLLSRNTFRGAEQ